MNPLYDNLVNESQIVPTAFFVDILNATEDPRRDVFFNPDSKKGGKYVKIKEFNPTRRLFY